MVSDVFLTVPNKQYGEPDGTARSLARDLGMPPLLLSPGKGDKQGYPQAAGHMFLGESFTAGLGICCRSY